MRQALPLLIVTWTCLQVHGLDIDEILLKDIIYPSSDKCESTDTNTETSFLHSVSLSDWDPVNSDREAKNFMAQMTHSDSDPNKSWTIRFGKGGSIYSMISGGYGEAIPPQTQEFSPWVDEVTQAVTVDLTKNNCANADECYFIHQAGTYFRDRTYLDEPFYSPNVAKHCEGNTCIFATWGQIASIPTIHKSDLLYVHQYRDCGNGVLEYTQMFVGYFGGQLAYLNMPWAGVRTSNLPDLYFSNIDFTLAAKEETIQGFGINDKLLTLAETGGYTTFAQNVHSDTNDNAALSYVHGVCEEYSDSSNDYFRAPSRFRFGLSERDFTVFTVNGRLTSKNPENSFVHRQFLINDRLGNISSQAQALIDEAYGDMLTPSDFNGRTLEIYSLNSDVFGIAAALEQGGTSTTCSKGTIVCSGTTVPSSGNVPFFTISCGSTNYFGPDKYFFAPVRDEEGRIRSYVCDNEEIGIVPQLKLLGFFPANGGCGSLDNAIYDPKFCEEEPVTSLPSRVTESPTVSPSNNPSIGPTLSQTLRPSKSPVSLPTIIPTTSSSISPSKIPSISPVSNPTLAPQKPSSCKSKQLFLELIIQADGRGKQTSYEIKKRNSKEKFTKKVMKKKRFRNNELYVKEKCLNKKKCYRFLIKDKKKDGICCKYGEGYYSLIVDGSEVKYSIFEGLQMETHVFGKC